MSLSLSGRLAKCDSQAIPKVIERQSNMSRHIPHSYFRSHPGSGSFKEVGDFMSVCVVVNTHEYWMLDNYVSLRMFRAIAAQCRQGNHVWVLLESARVALCSISGHKSEICGVIQLTHVKTHQVSSSTRQDLAEGK